MGGAFLSKPIPSDRKRYDANETVYNCFEPTAKLRFWERLDTGELIMVPAEVAYNDMLHQFEPIFSESGRAIFLPYLKFKACISDPNMFKLFDIGVYYVQYNYIPFAPRSMRESANATMKNRASQKKEQLQTMFKEGHTYIRFHDQ